MQRLDAGNISYYIDLNESDLFIMIPTLFIINLLWLNK